MTKHFATVFERDNRRCVYCGRDMMVDFETFLITEEDHLVPISAGGEDKTDNIVIACAVCNRMKGRYVPRMEYSQEKRREYIEDIRNHIMQQRAKHMRDFASWTHSTSNTVTRTSDE